MTWLLLLKTEFSYPGPFNLTEREPDRSVAIVDILTRRTIGQSCRSTCSDYIVLIFYRDSYRAFSVKYLYLISPITMATRGCQTLRMNAPRYTIDIKIKKKRTFEEYSLLTFARRPELNKPTNRSKEKMRKTQLSHQFD